MFAKKVIITGVTGFIGSSLAEYFLQKGYEVIGLSRYKILNMQYKVLKISYTVQEIAKIIFDEKPDVLIHSAGSASVTESIDNPLNDFNKSVHLFHYLLNGIRISKEKPLVVFLSSAAVYGNPDVLPIKESAPLKPISPYGFHKLICEKLGEEYSLCYEIPVAIIRLFSVFGPMQKRLLIWELFDKFQNKKVVEIKGTGNESRDYIYIDDLAYIISNIIKEINKEYIVLNVASGQACAVKVITDLMKKYMNSRKEIYIKKENVLGDPLNWCADISKCLNIIGNKKIPPFKKRLSELINIWRNEKLNQK